MSELSEFGKLADALAGIATNLKHLAAGAPDAGDPSHGDAFRVEEGAEAIRALVTCVREAEAKGRQAGIAQERDRLIPAPSDIEDKHTWQQGFYSGLLVSHPEAVRKTAERIAEWLKERAMQWDDRVKCYRGTGHDLLADTYANEASAFRSVEAYCRALAESEDKAND